MKQLKYFVIGTDGSIKFVSVISIHNVSCWVDGGGLKLHWKNISHKVVLFFVVDLCEVALV